MKMNPERPTLRHIIIKMTKLKDKERILKAAREEQEVTHKGALKRSSQQKHYKPEGNGKKYSK